MKRKFLLHILLLVLSMSCLAQKWGTKEYIEKYNYKEVIGEYIKSEGGEIPDKYAMYPNGKKGINSVISKKIKIPLKVIKNKLGGIVILKYVVDEEGYVTDIEVEKSANKYIDKAAVKSLKSMKRWIPAKVANKNVRIGYKHPFRFNF